VSNKVPDLFEINYYLTGISEKDTDFIIELRTNEDLNSLSGKSLLSEEHIKWLENYYQRDNDFYWIVRDIKSNERISTAALFDIDKHLCKAESGRYII